MTSGPSSNSVIVMAKRNYPKENKWEDTPEQVRRRMARNRARARAERQGRVKKGDGKELDHVGYHPYGAHALDKVPTKVTSRHANRVRQPPHKRKRK